MKKITTLFFLFATVFSLNTNQLFSRKKTVNINKDRYKWYKKYISNQKVKDEMEFMDDQLLGHSRRLLRLLGIVSTSWGSAIKNARVTLIHSESKKRQETFTDKNGFYSFPVIKNAKGFYRIKVSAKRHMTLTKSINLHNRTFGVDFKLQSASSQVIKKGETKTVFDSNNQVQLTIPANILKRMDGRMLQFPVSVKLSYINPENNLLQMPGLEMLSYSYQGKMNVMTSVGAVNIEAKDKTGAPVRIDFRKAKRLKKSTSLKIKVNPYLKRNKLSKRVRTWSFDPEKKDLSWKPTRQIIKLNNTNRILASKAKPLQARFLKKYAQDVLKRIKQSKYFSVYSCVNNKNKVGKDLRLGRGLSEEDLLKGLIYYIHRDLRELNQSSLNNASCLLKFYDEQSVMHNFFHKIFDANFDSNWYDAGTYSCKGRGNHTTYPAKLTAGFDYSPLLKMAKNFCDIYEAAEWENAAVIESVDLVPFNLDVPHKGYPALFKLNELGGDGKYKVIIEQDHQEKGKFKIERIINSPNKAFQLKIFVPDGGTLSLQIFTQLRSQKPKVKRTFMIPRADKSYQWDRSKESIVDMNGNPVEWKYVSEVNF